MTFWAGIGRTIAAFLPWLQGSSCGVGSPAGVQAKHVVGPCFRIGVEVRNLGRFLQKNRARLEKSTSANVGHHISNVVTRKRQEMTLTSWASTLTINHTTVIDELSFTSKYTPQKVLKVYLKPC